MSLDVLELLQARIDLEHVTLPELIAASKTEEGLDMLLRNEQIISGIIDLTENRIEGFAEYALQLLVNITASAKGSKEILKYKPTNHNNIISLLITFVLNPQKKNADAACIILASLTGARDALDLLMDTFLPHLNDILNVFVNIDFNKAGSNLNYLAPVFSNLSQTHRMKNWLTEENPHAPLVKLLPFCNYEGFVRRGGIICMIRTLSIEREFHSFLLRPDLDLLTYLLSPLMGNEDYPVEVMARLPISLQHLPKEKEREDIVVIRKLILETLNELCCTIHGWEIFRDNGVYYVLREYHKWEKDSKALLICENVLDILIEEEEEGESASGHGGKVPENG